MICLIILIAMIFAITLMSHMFMTLIFPTMEDESDSIVCSDPKPFTAVGNLQVKVSEDYSHQDYVFDPVDGERFYVNSKDDRYEDAAGKIWRLIRK